MGYEQARGAVPWHEGDEPPEDIIRRMRGGSSQLDLFTGHPRPATGNAIRNQLAEIMEAEPETQDDEDLLAARWLILHGGFDPVDGGYLAQAIGLYRKANLRARRQELRELYPYSAEEEARRQARGRGGPPG